MEENKQSKKELKKAYKRQKRRLVTPWKVLTIFSLIITILLWPLFGVLKTFDNTVAAFVGGTFWELENEDPNAIYFEGDFASTEEMNAYGMELCETVEGEGAALLMNENDALPLAKGAAVSCISTSSVNLV